RATGTRGETRDGRRAMTFSELHDEIRRREGTLAYGSETAIFGTFADQMRRIGGRGWQESEAEVPADDAAWWLRAYDLYEADAGLPADERAMTIQELFDRV